jgi:redox-sensitive bicupin YhaK (pirin superfamily)
MKIIKRNKLRRGGFAGLRETRLVMSPRLFRGQQETGTSSGVGRFVYLADARFLPHGDTRMHTHSEIDVISVMLEGRIQHEGSLQHGQELQTGSIQVQRAGGEGFSHNEINPDPVKNRMIQLWIIPETPGEPAAYQMFEAGNEKRTRVYGGPADQDETFAARTIIEIAQLKDGESINQPGRCLVYITVGNGESANEFVEEGDLVDTRDFSYKAKSDSKLILVYENQSINRA